MEIMKKVFPTIVLFSLGLLIIISNLSLSFQNKPVGSIHGASLDSKGNLYVGFDNGLWVMYANAEDGHFEHLPIPEAQTYTFFIQDDTITVSSKGSYTSEVYTLDGKLLSKIDLSYQEAKTIAGSVKELRQDGETYTWSKQFSLKPAVIYRNNDLLYQMTIPGFLLSGIPYSVMLLVLFFALMIALIQLLTDEDLRRYLNSLRR